MAISPITVQSTQGQTGFFNAYPYTDFHELNLDFLLATYKSIVDKANEIIEWANNHQIEYEEAIERLTAVENEIDTFEAQITAAFNQLKAEVARAIIELQNILNANNEFIFQYVENRLQKFIDDLPEILTVQVYNPYRGEVTDIQTAINDIYNVACIWGLTASQYDSLGLTAAEYDGLGLTAQEYDTLGYKLLYKDPDHYMLSPFDGTYVHVQEVIMDLAHLHMGGVTAEYYDGLELTAEEYDNKELTAFQYDWFADELLTA